MFVATLELLKSTFEQLGVFFLNKILFKNNLTASRDLKVAVHIKFAMCKMNIFIYKKLMPFLINTQIHKHCILNDLNKILKHLLH